MYLVPKAQSVKAGTQTHLQHLTSQLMHLQIHSPFSPTKSIHACNQLTLQIPNYFPQEKQIPNYYYIFMQHFEVWNFQTKERQANCK
jgi:hypothetical protein